MIRQACSFAIWAVVCVGFGRNGTASASPVAPSIAAIESGARATLNQNAVELDLPFTAPAAKETRVVAWFLSPDNSPSVETAVTVTVGSRSAHLVLPWPKGRDGKPVEEIGWYRIGYRIESAGASVAHGILSVGAITPNLLALRLAKPETLVAGVPISVRVFAGNPVTRRPFRGVLLKATLTFDDDTGADKPVKQPIVRSAATGSNGEAILNFPGMSEPGETATLKVEGTLTGARGAAVNSFAHASLESDLEARERVVFHPETDKPLHKPGETVHLRTLVFNDSGHAAANAPLTLTISDPDSKTLLKVPLTTNRFGIAFYDWKTSSQTATGDYEANFDEDDTSEYGENASITLPIERYELPEFKVTATMDRSFYLEGQLPVAKIHASYLFGKPVAAGSVKIFRAEEGTRYPRKNQSDESEKPVASGVLDSNGDASFRLDVKNDFDDFRSNDYERYRDLRYRAIVTDQSTGRSEPRNFIVRLTHDPVHIYLSRPVGDDREGDVLVSTAYADGTPVACKVELDWMDEDSKATRAAAVDTNRYGLAKVHLRYPASAVTQGDQDIDVRVVARDPEGRISTFDDTLRPGPAGALWISVARPLLRSGEPIDATIHGVPGEEVDVDVLSATETLAHLQVRIHHNAEPLTLPSDSRFRGLISLRAYRMSQDVTGYDDWSGDSSDKSVLYPDDRELRVKLNGIKPSYLPGADVNAALRVRDAAGAPIAGAVGVTVFDNAVAQRAETEEEENNRWFGWNWWLEGPQAGGVTRDDLDKVNAAQPIPDDLQLAAEAVLENEPANLVEVEGTSDETIRNEYTKSMQHQLQPLGQAIVAVSTPHLPQSFEAIQQVARNANFDPALLDPWNTPYKVEAPDQVTEELIRFRSAGPDKRFDTDDDLVIDVARRNLFAVPGRQLTHLLTHAAASGHPLPANLDQLKALAAEAGLDLNSDAAGTRAPGGKPFTYAFVVQRRFYFIQVLRESGVEVWSSPSIDYFSSTEAGMDDALHAWTRSGRAFPATEAEARQAFSAAGIDFDALRDPLGRSFELRAKQVMAYARAEQIKAGDHLQVQTKPVTQLMRAIQIARRPEAALGETAENAELVAQFLHPLSEQSGSDLKPQPVDEGIFKGNAGAIGGTVTDQTGAVIPGATATVKSASGVETTATTGPNGMYLLSDLAPGIYRLNVGARGFLEFSVCEVRVSAASLTTVDVTLRVGTTTETVTVEAAALPVMPTSAAEAVSISQGVFGGNKKTIVTGPGGRAQISEPVFTPRLRHVFDETAYWAPSLETGANGRTSLSFHLPDSLTTWNLHALASTSDGRVGALEKTFETFQPFFIDLDAPQVLTAGDELTLPVNLRNYTAQALALPVTVTAAAWFQALTPTSQRVTVPAGASVPFNFGFRATGTVDEGLLRLTATNGQEGDAVEKQIRVHPDGEPGSVTASGLLRGASTTLSVDLPSDLIPGSLHGQLLLYPNLGAQIVHSMQASLERPYGCAEQLISSTYPSLLFLELLKASKSNSALETKAQTFLQLGYDKLDSYFNRDGGLTYWGGNDHDSDAALTAYGIEFLNEASPFLRVNHDRIVAAMRWLISAQQSDGSWKPRYGEPSAELTLYVAQALQRAASDPGMDAENDLRVRARTAVSRALNWADHSAAAVHDPYANAIRLQVAIAASDKSSIQSAHDVLISTVDRDRDGAHWSREGHSPFYGWGRAGDLETTAIAFSALEAQALPSDRPLLDDVLYFLLRSRDNLGIWYSGQATMRVLKSLLLLATQQIASPAGAAEFKLSVNGAALDAGNAAKLRSSSSVLDAPRTLDLTTMLKPGRNELSFTGAGDAALASAEVSTSFYVPWPPPGQNESAHATTGRDYGLDFNYTCNLNGAKVGQPVDCTVDARRFGSQGFGMLLAEVGLPPGADVDRASLGKLLDDWTISSYELQPDRIVFYLWPWRAEGSHFGFRFTPRYPMHAKAAPATLSDYYNPDLQVTLAPQAFNVK
jgi:hypothetical protein